MQSVCPCTHCTCLKQPCMCTHTTKRQAHLPKLRLGTGARWPHAGRHKIAKISHCHRPALQKNNVQGTACAVFQSPVPNIAAPPMQPGDRLGVWLGSWGSLVTVRMVFWGGLAVVWGILGVVWGVVGGVFPLVGGGVGLQVRSAADRMCSVGR